MCYLYGKASHQSTFWMYNENELHHSERLFPAAKGMNLKNGQENSDRGDGLGLNYPVVCTRIMKSICSPVILQYRVA